MKYVKASGEGEADGMIEMVDKMNGEAIFIMPTTKKNHINVFQDHFF